jgi:anthranilate synthase/aminodeoxychorismate synthase-like glutamine amidotransferase
VRLVLVDAYDSFTHNLAQGFAALGAEVRVVACDAVDAEGLARLAPDRLVFGPGPGRPEDAGCFVDAIRAWTGRVPVLGVCLGHQALVVAHGGALRRFPPKHGLASPVHHDGTGLFTGLPPAPEMGRYHSLGVDADRVPASLRVLAWSEDGVVMAVAHRTAPAFGVQFHPESVMSGAPGLRLMHNFLSLEGAAAP